MDQGNDAKMRFLPEKTIAIIRLSDVKVYKRKLVFVVGSFYLGDRRQHVC
jgi:hypothetical protein